MLTFPTEPQGPPRAAPHRGRPPRSQPRPRLDRVDKGLRDARLRHRRQVGPRPSYTKPRRSPAVRQARRDPSHLPRGPQEPAQDCVARVFACCPGHGARSVHWGVSLFFLLGPGSLRANCRSGLVLAATLATPPRPLAMRRSRTPSFSDPSSPWMESSFCTIARGTCSRHCR